MSVSVLELVRARAADGSVSGVRKDPYRLALAIEGAGSRGTYSSGMVVELERRGFTQVFDDVYGSSMGAITGAWLLPGKAEHGASFWWHPEVMPNGCTCRCRGTASTPTAARSARKVGNRVSKCTEGGTFDW